MSQRLTVEELSKLSGHELRLVMDQLHAYYELQGKMLKLQADYADLQDRHIQLMNTYEAHLKGPK